MDTVNSPLPDQLANISPVVVIAVVAALTLIRIAIAKNKDTWARTLSEVCDTINFVLILAFLLIRPFVAQAFYIPSPSMENTLLVRDRLIVDKFSYRLHSPHRHDVVVFEAPPEATTEKQEGIDFIKRLIGEPGDTIQVKAAKLAIGGSVEAEEPHEFLRQELSLGQEDSIKIFPDHILIDGDKTMSLTEIATAIGQPGVKITLTPGETLVNGKVQDEPYTREDPNYDFPANGGSFTVPKGNYFMMGDNRNYSMDSHIWGPLEERRVVGRATVVFWPLSRLGKIR